MKALAVGLQRSIITISTSSMCLHSPEVVDVIAGLGKMAFVSYPSSQSGEERHLPLEVLDDRTWYMIYNNRDHYWAAYSAGPVRTQAELEEGDMVLDVRKSKRARHASIKQRL